MKLKLTWLMTLMIAFAIQISYAQEKSVSGTITSATDGLPLPGVNVIVKGTTRGVQSDFDGNYTIRASANETLVYSFIGLKTEERNVGANSTINVQMNEDAAALEEVVVTGYATQTKAKSNVSSVRVTAATIENRPNASFVQTLSGQVPGLNITTSSGQPGANATVQLRGVSSINGDTEPLFIIDGAPVDQDNFRSLNPQDIASIDVLKDAGATSIYGNRGANGVIVIKTRQGSFNQGLKVNYQGFVAFSTLQDNDYKYMDAQQLLTYERSRGRGAGGGALPNILFNNGNTEPLTDAEIAAAPNFSWLDFFFSTGVTQNHNLSLSSGGENSSQFTSFGFNETDGILVNSSLKRFNLRNNVTGRSSNEKFNYATNLTLNYSTSGEPNAVGTGGVNQNYVLGAFQSAPYITPDLYVNGAQLVGAGTPFVHTPLFLLDKIKGEPRVEDEVRLVGSLITSYALTDYLTANMTMGADYQNEIFTLTRRPDSFNALLFGGAANPTAGFQQQDTRRVFTYNQVTSLNFNETWGKHTVDVGAYTEYFKAHLRSFGFTAQGLDPKTVFPGDGAGFVDDSGDNDFYIDLARATVRNAGLFSYFGRASYDYDERFGVEGTVRRDASYRFSGSNRWATFWSVSGRWNISNEAFMDDSVFNVLKLRGSYGTAGNQDITGGGLFGGPDLYRDLFVTGGGYANNNAIALAQFGNRSLIWEEIATANIGIDFEMFNRRLRGAFDVYERKTSDLFQDTPLSAVTGFTNLPSNTGNLTNKGVDFQLDYDVVRATTSDGFNLKVGINGNYNENELSNVPNETGEIPGIGRNGGPLGEYFTIRYAGVNPANGNLLFLDAAGNLTETPDGNSNVWTGKNIIPDWQGGINLNIDYKNFFFTTQWNYVFGVDRFDNDYAGAINPTNVGLFNFSTDILRSWSQPGDITDIPSPTAFNNNTFGSTRFLRSADYVRLRFASFGYSLPAKYLENTGFNNFRIFFNGENLFTFTEWRGFDPETRSNGSRQFPTPRTLSVGFELGF